jgi:hypothetical protein
MDYALDSRRKSQRLTLVVFTATAAPTPTIATWLVIVTLHAADSTPVTGLSNLCPLLSGLGR